MLKLLSFSRSMNFITLLALTFFTLNLQNAFAKPEYAEREGKACQYCHIESNPGKVDGKTGKRFSTERGEKGLYYGNHNHSFAGYVTKVVVNPLPKLTYSWQEECTDLPTRVAVADAWDAYLTSWPSGQLAPEARFNRAVCLVKLERWPDADLALRALVDDPATSRRADVDRMRAIVDAAR